MTTREPEEARDEALAPFVRDTAEQLERALAAARPARDFAAMMARASALAADDELDAPDELEPDDALAPVIPLPPRKLVDDATALAPFTAALRAELAVRIAERGMAAIPPPPVVRRGGRILAAAVAVAAAVALLVFGSATELRRDDRPGGTAAVDAGHRTISGAAERPAPLTPVVPAPVVPVVPKPAESDAQPVPTDSVPAPVAKDTASDKPRRRPVEVGGPSLEDEAQALWQRGELAAAEQKYREIVRIAGKGRRAELAYGDLFALVRQIRGADGQLGVWREYLARFPDGRFADDARAGLCQRAAADERATCWRDYLEHHPDGAHRSRAEQTLGDAP